MKPESAPDPAGRLEDVLASAPRRDLPPAWKTEILAAAVAASTTPSATAPIQLPSKPRSAWTAWWRIPPAYAAFGTVWAVILAILGPTSLGSANRSVRPTGDRPTAAAWSALQAAALRAAGDDFEIGGATSKSAPVGSSNPPRSDATPEDAPGFGRRDDVLPMVA
jgi:hypothetical protein